MLLPAHLDPAGQAVGRPRQGRPTVALGVDAGPVLEPAAGGQRVLDGKQRGPRRDLDPAEPRSLAGGQVAGGGNGEDRLTHVMHGPGGQQRLVMGGGRHVIGEGQVGGGQHRHHAGGRAHGVEIHGGDLAMGGVRQPERQVQAVRGRRDVVDVSRGAGDVLPRAVVGQGLRDAHARTSSTEPCRASEASSLARRPRAASSL